MHNRLKACPDCGGSLGKEAKKCRCGWMAPGYKPEEEKRGYTPCAASSECRRPGLMWIRTIREDERLCVDHYTQAVEKNRELRHDHEDAVERQRRRSLMRSVK
jgi:hypothetical protein